MAPIRVRYIVYDVDATIAFYTQHLDFIVKAHAAPGFAVLKRGDLNLLVNAKNGQGRAAQAMPDGRKPEPGGWNRIQIEAMTWAALSRPCVKHFRNDIVIDLWTYI